MDVSIISSARKRSAVRCTGTPVHMPTCGTTYTHAQMWDHPYTGTHADVCRLSASAVCVCGEWLNPNKVFETVPCFELCQVVLLATDVMRFACNGWTKCDETIAEIVYISLIRKYTTI
jgi:hypothetical protein